MLDAQRVRSMVRFAILVTCWLFAPSAMSQQPQRAPSKAPTASAAKAAARQIDNYLWASFVPPDDAALPVQFVGHSPAGVADALAKVLDVKKGEFETSVQFEARRDEALTRPILGTLTLNDRLLFTVSVKKHTTYSSGLSYDYDADKQQLSLFVVSLETKPNGIGGPNMSLPTIESIRTRSNALGLITVELTSEKISENEYSASNAYGATLKVSSTAYKSVEIGAALPAFVPKRTRFDAPPEPAMIIAMPVNRAQTLLPSLRALLITKSVPPYLEYNFIHSAPTRNAPSEFSSQQRLIRADIEQVWFFVPASGEVVAKLPAR